MSTHPTATQHLRLEVREALSDAAGEVNEDGYTLGENQIWVIDGASGLSERTFTPGPSDAAWLTHTALSVVQESPPQSLDITLGHLVDTLTTRLTALGATAHHAPHELPSASLAAIRLTNTDLEVLTLGDCRLIVRTSSDHRLHVTTSPELDRLDQQSVAELVAAQARTGDDLRTCRSYILPTLRHNRDLMNRPGGYRALAPTLHTPTVEIPIISVDAGTSGLLASDGLYRLVDTFERYTPADLLAAAERDGLEALLRELRALEAADPDAHDSPRLKTSDDATGVLFEITAS